MDAKDLRAEAALTERSNDGVSKFSLQYDRTKNQDAGTNAFKVDTTSVRPCAVIGPDRVVPPARDGTKKAPVEPWLTPDPIYRRLPDYPYKMPDHKDPTRNISPRQTFQENMQRIIMPPGYNAIKLHEDSPFTSKNTKLNVPTEVKYCEVPYNINPVSSDQKHIRNADHSASNVNPLLMRGVPHGWPAGSVHVRPMRTFGAPEVLPYPDYANCTGPRPVLTRTHASAHEETLYPDPYYHESNIRYKPYPNIKERYPQSRYEYLGNYPSPYHPPNPFVHKYELPKTMPPHSYPGYPQVPKYTERITEPLMDGYQRALTQQGNYGVPIRNPVIHSPYRPVPGNQMQNKVNAYPPDLQHKPVPNKLPYDPASKMYLDYDRSKPIPMTDNYYLNDLSRPYHAKNSIVVPNFTPSSIHGVNAHPYYIKENMSYPRYKNMDPSMMNHSLTKLPPQFSPSTLAISPADSNASNETAHTYGTSQEDCGYVSQSSVTSVRSVDSLNRIPMDPYGRYDYRYGPIVRASPSIKTDPSSNQGSKSKKDIRQFISSWSEGDDENTDNSAKRDNIKNISDEKHTLSKQYDSVNNQGQLYVLGLVNVPSEELSKYEHIQKVSKLPENIKGYNSLELLNQFEEAIESSNITSAKPATPRTVQMPLKSMPHKHDLIPRPLSPLDVEAKISQSVIHKEVGCNFEIKPCSPKMLNVEVATPMQMLNERVIEKVANPHNIKSPIILQGVDENVDDAINKIMKCPLPNTASSCKMINSQHQPNSPTIDNLKTSYTLQDLESNSGVCLASLPRLDTDIELNFPEVNQQFINANKTDSVITTSFTKDLPTLDLDRSTNTSAECDINYQYSPKIEHGTDFSRLSKYRKLKRCIPDENDTAIAKVQATRVDSVIIKNPDNTKSIEETSNNTESQFSDDLQEFAMNLVSQTKYSNHQDNLDKMLDTSTSSSIAGRCDDGKPDVCNTFTHQQSNTLLNKQINVIEETSGNVTQLETSNHNKDLAKEHFDKAIPMNLSPQAKCAPEVDEENSKTSNKIAISEETLQFAVDNTDPANKIQNEEKYISCTTLDKPDHLMNSEKDVSGIKSCNTHNEPQAITNSPVNFAMVLPNELEINNHEELISVMHVENQTSLTKTVAYNKDEETMFENKKTMDFSETAGSREDRVEDIMDSKKEWDRNSLHTDKANHKVKIDHIHKEHNIFPEQYHPNNDNISYVPKLKRKKFRGVATHRKRGENKSVIIAGQNIKNNKEKQSTILPKANKDPVEQQTAKQHQTTPESIAEKSIATFATQINFISNDRTEIIKSERQGRNNIHLNTENDLMKRRHENNENNKNILQNVSEDIETHVLLPCSPIKDKFLEKNIEIEMETTLTNDLPRHDIDVKECNENADYVVQTKLISDDMVDSTEKPNKYASELQASISNNYETEYINTLVRYHQDETQSNNNNNINLQNQVINILSSDIEEKKSNEINQYPIINSDMKEIVTSDVTDLNEEPHAETNVENLNTSIESNETALNRSHENFETMLSKNEVEMVNNEDNIYHENVKLETFEDLSEARKNTQVCRSFVHKELFSSRFQNLLFYNEILDICSNVGEFTVDEQSTLKNSLYDRESEHLKIRLTNEFRIQEHIGGLNSIDKIITTEVNTNTEICADLTVATCLENNNMNYDFGKCTKNEDYKEIHNLSPETEITSNEIDMKNVDPFPKPVESSVCESSSKVSCNEFEENIESEIEKRASNIQFTTEDTALKSAENYVNEPYSPEMEDESGITENSDGESESDLQFANKDISPKSVYSNGPKSSSKESDRKCIKNSENINDECKSDLKFTIQDTVPISAVNFYDSFSSGIVEECVKNTGISSNESNSDLEFTNKHASPKSVENSSCKSSTREMDNVGVKNVENSNDECDFGLQFTNNVESDVCSTNIIVIDEAVSVSPEDCDEYNKPATNKIQSFIENLSSRPSISLKRSLSDSALNAYDDEIDNSSGKRCMLPKKRKKLRDISKLEESHLLNILQSSRRNSVSTLSNENFSFCILIDDHCIVTEENYEQENFIQLENHLLNHPLKHPVAEEDKIASPVYNLEDQNGNTSDTFITKYDEKVWVDDVGCEETIETEDIAENIVIGDPTSPKDTDSTDYDTEDEAMDTLNNEDADHTSKVKHIYGNNMCTNDAQLVDALYKTPQMDVNKKLMDKESHMSEKFNKYYDSDSLEMLLAEPVGIISRVSTESNINGIDILTEKGPQSDPMNKENRTLDVPSPLSSNIKKILTNIAIPNEDIKSIHSLTKAIGNDNCDEAQEDIINQCESNLDNVFSNVDKRGNLHKSSSSPEVSSTTSEEKNSSILLKISSFKGSRISEVKSLVSDKQKQNSCKHTTNEYFKSDYCHGTPKRPLLTKAAQKYIPPLRESIPDLRVKLALPQQHLLKLQKNKVAKDEPKVSTPNMYSNNNNFKLKKEIPKKIKPKFEDVLKNIDEVQFQMQKAKNKKPKKYIPKVVIKKSENGSHYASTCAKDSVDPDLTGRKWQPWVFIEKNKLIDNMARRNKTRAVFSHRKKTFVLAEKYCKYKSVSTAKFVISQPKLNDFSTGNLKYTIKLKQR